MKIGVIGGGFGIYGWMPALCQYYSSEKISMNVNHKKKFSERKELRKYDKKINWISISEIINDSEFLVIAIPPHEVFNYLDLIKKSDSIKKIIVEKPICETPEKSEKFINEIEKSGIKICSSYLFRYLNWFEKIKSEILESDVRLEWSIKKRESVWKNDTQLGGGALSFYGIHLLSIISMMKYTSFEIIENTPIHFEVVFRNINKSFLIRISICEKNSFTINDFFKDENPFGILNKKNDFRIEFIKKLINDFEENYDDVNSLMKKTNNLWKIIYNSMNDY